MNTPSETPTPRTDKFISNCKCKRGKKVTDNFTRKELADFTRQLERELAEANDGLNGTTAHLNKIIDGLEAEIAKSKETYAKVIKPVNDYLGYHAPDEVADYYTDMVEADKVISGALDGEYEGRDTMQECVEDMLLKITEGTARENKLSDERDELRAKLRAAGAACAEMRSVIENAQLYPAHWTNAAKELLTKDNIGEGWKSPATIKVKDTRITELEQQLAEARKDSERKGNVITNLQSQIEAMNDAAIESGNF